MNLQKLHDSAMKTVSKIQMRYKHVCFILYNGEIVAKGHNQLLTRGHSSIHAEEMACSKIPPKIDPKKCILIVFRVNKNGELRNSKPCPSCETLIKKKGVGLVMYS